MGTHCFPGNNKQCRRPRGWHFATDLMNATELYNTGPSAFRVSKVLFVSFRLRWVQASRLRTVWGQTITWPDRPSKHVCSCSVEARAPVRLGGNTRVEHGGARGQRGARLHLSHRTAGVWWADEAETFLYLLMFGSSLSDWLATCCAFTPKVEMGSWTLFAKRLLLLWRTLIEENRPLPLNKDSLLHHDIFIVKCWWQFV